MVSPIHVIEIIEIDRLSFAEAVRELGCRALKKRHFKNVHSKTGTPTTVHGTPHTLKTANRF